MPNTQISRMKYQLYTAILSKNFWVRKSINQYIGQLKLKGKYPKPVPRYNVIEEEQSGKFKKA